MRFTLHHHRCGATSRGSGATGGGEIPSQWEREAEVVGAKTAEKLGNFLTSLLDNNQDGYFYLHQDIGLGIQQNCCAFLPLSVALKIDHYNLCLEAKIAELTDTFQAKLVLSSPSI